MGNQDGIGSVSSVQVADLEAFLFLVTSEQVTWKKLINMGTYATMH